MAHIEVFINVWNCEARLRCELWDGNSMIDGINVPVSEAEIAASVEHINRSGRYPVQAGTLTQQTGMALELALDELENRHPDQMRAAGVWGI